MKNIPVDQLQNKTSTGLQIKSFRAGDEHPQQAKNDIAHRDDHYIFFLLTDGSGTLKVDFEKIVLTAGHLYYILPSQVHSKIKADRAEGWFLAVDTALVPGELREVFESRLNLQLPCKLTGYELTNYGNLLKLLQNEVTQRKGDKFYLSIIHSLVRSFLAMAASSYSFIDPAKDKHSRPAELARQFKTLLAVNIQTMKSPSAYASELHVTTGHLNESIKKITGSTVSYWIRQEAITEAKRLLYHSDITVKEIAHELGFSDCAYFIRSFRQACGVSPLKFRSLNRD